MFLARFPVHEDLLIIKRMCLGGRGGWDILLRGGRDLPVKNVAIGGMFGGAGGRGEQCWERAVPTGWNWQGEFRVANNPPTFIRTIFSRKKWWTPFGSSLLSTGLIFR